MAADIDYHWILSTLGEDFRLLAHEADARPYVLHTPSGISFRFIPSGQFLMGLSEEEENAAKQISEVRQFNVDEMRPLQSKKVTALLVSTTPILNRHCADRCDEPPDHPAYFDRSSAEIFSASLGFRLPLEFEREYFCRAGTTSLFPFGNQVPSDSELERWLSIDFSNPGTLKSNNFGLYGIFNPEWCADKFRIDLSPDAPELDGSFVIRGGGSYFWPWQDEEWVWCMSAIRSPSSALEDGQACLRLVYDLNLK